MIVMSERICGGTGEEKWWGLGFNANEPLRRTAIRDVSGGVGGPLLETFPRELEVAGIVV